MNIVKYESRWRGFYENRRTACPWCDKVVDFHSGHHSHACYSRYVFEVDIGFLQYMKRRYRELKLKY